MPAIAMKVITARKHPGADALRVYTFEAPGVSPCQVVANLENVYRVGDIVAVVRAGSTLLDGTVISKARLRGVPSMGMAVGVIDARLGQDLSERFCRAEDPSVVPHLPWASIGSLSDVARELTGRAAYHEGYVMPVVEYRAKVKLHGTNGGVQISPDGLVVAQSRTITLTPETDSSMGFARWVDARVEAFSALARETRVVIYGEFCGPGIQRGVALSQLDRKVFAIFAVQLGDDVEHEARLEVDPERIGELLGALPADTFVLPWYGEPLRFDHGARDTLEAPVAATNAMVDAVERCDPWVREVFGVEGLGEGVVMFPVVVEGGFDVRKEAADRDALTHLLFKAKGKKHAVKKTRAPAQIAPEIADSIDAFVEMFVTDARCEQGVVEACEGEASMRRTGHFLKWINADIQKESTAELEAAGLTWKQVSKAVGGAARGWFMARARADGGSKRRRP